MQWPYKLSAEYLGLLPRNADGTSKFTDVVLQKTDCTNTQGAQCKQRWNSILSLNERTCTLTGSYSLNYTKICSTGSSPTECPLVGGQNTSIFFTIQSEDFCATIEIDVALVGVLEVFEMADYTLPRKDFVIGRTAYFRVSVDSELNFNAAGQNPDRSDDSVKFQSTKVIEISFIVKSAGNVVTAISLYKNSETPESKSVNANTVVNFVDSPYFEKSGFQITFTKALINLASEAVAGKGLPANSKFTFSISAVTRVAFVDNKAGSKKRLIEGIQQVLAEAGADQSSSSFSSDVDIPDANVTATDTATGTPATTTPATATGTATGTGTGTATTAAGSTATSGSTTSGAATKSETTANAVSLFFSAIFFVLALLF
jgi:hypothetical protein